MKRKTHIHPERQKKTKKQYNWKEAWERKRKKGKERKLDTKREGERKNV